MESVTRALLRMASHCEEAHGHDGAMEELAEYVRDAERWDCTLRAAAKRIRQRWSQGDAPSSQGRRNFNPNLIQLCQAVLIGWGAPDLISPIYETGRFEGLRILEERQELDRQRESMGRTFAPATVRNTERGRRLRKAG